MKKAKWVILASLVFLIFGIFFIRVSEPKVKVPEIILPSAIKLIDDFNDGVDPNLVGGNQFISASDGAFCRSLYNKTEILEDHGFSCEISFYVPPDGWVIWGAHLNELDISASEELSFWIKGAKGKEEFKLILEDAQKNKTGLDITRYVNINKAWQKVAIPISDFKDVDFNELLSLSFIFRSKAGERSGTIYIEDIGFRGKPEIFLNSLKDNLYGFPARKLLEDQKIRKLLVKEDRELLHQIAKDTWGYFRNIVDKRSALPLDFIKLGSQPKIGDYTSPTNIGLYFICVISACDLGFIDKAEALNRLKQSLATIEKLPKWNGLLYNFYSTTNLQIGRKYISSVDNGWLAAGLILIRQTFRFELGKACDRLLNKMDFSLFYDEKLGQMNLGYDTDIGALSPYHYGLLATEPGLLSFIAIGKGDVSKEHWFRIFRALPKDWDWQSQTPHGETRTYLGIEVFEGYYTYGDIKIVPSWGGSLFEFLMPTIFMKEKELAPQGLGLNDANAVKAHIKFASEKGYPVWGISPSTTPDGSYGGYTEFGVAALATQGYKDEGVITPHVSFLALYFTPQEAMDNIRKMLELYPIYGEYGLYDSVNLKTQTVGYSYLALDQGMILPAINNYLNKGILRERFHRDKFIGKIEGLLSMEKFF